MCAAEGAWDGMRLCIRSADALVGEANLCSLNLPYYCLCLVSCERICVTVSFSFAFWKGKSVLIYSLALPAAAVLAARFSLEE